MTTAAVLWDMDGLLIDSEPLWFDVEFETITSLGGTWTPADQERCIGGTIVSSCAYMLTKISSAITAAELQDRIVNTMVAKLKTEVPLQPGALSLLQALKSAGIPMALVSSSWRVLVDSALAGIPESGFFATTVAGDEVTNGKPDPEPYLTAAARLGVSPTSCVVLEDAINGVRSAEAAGCLVIAVPSIAPIDATPTRHVVRSLLDIDVDWLISLIRT